MSTTAPGMFNPADPYGRRRQPGPVTPQPTTTQPSPMAGYVDRQTNARLQSQAAPTAAAPAYKPPAPTIATAAQQQPSQAAPQQSRAQYTPTAPTIPQAGPAPMAGAAGSTLQDPGQITDAGKAYAARVAQNLQGNNPLVQNAQAAEDTAAARRAYSARKGATEMLAQTPYSPGGAQYQRAMAETQAGVDVANQAGRNQVNAVTRQATADAMAAASGLEDQQFGRAIGERTNSQLQAQQLANSIQDPKAKYAFQRAIAAGADPQEAFGAIVGETGAIAAPYRGQSPVETVRQDASDWIKATQPSLVEGSPEFAAAVTERMQAVDSAQRQPISASNREGVKSGVLEKMRIGESLTEDEQVDAIKTGAIAAATPTTIPKGSNVNGWLKDNPSGLISIDGQVVKILGGGRYTRARGGVGKSNKHTDFSHVQYDGQEYWVDANGNWFDRDPNEFESGGGFGGKFLKPEKAKEKSIPNPLKKGKKKETA